MDTAFPTLKRGANKHCAYGAAARTFLLQSSIKPCPCGSEGPCSLRVASQGGRSPGVVWGGLRQSGMNPPTCRRCPDIKPVELGFVLYHPSAGIPRSRSLGSAYPTFALRTWGPKRAPLGMTGFGGGWAFATTTLAARIHLGGPRGWGARRVGRGAVENSSRLRRVLRACFNNDPACVGQSFRRGY